MTAGAGGPTTHTFLHISDRGTNILKAYGKGVCRGVLGTRMQLRTFLACRGGTEITIKSFLCREPSVKGINRQEAQVNRTLIWFCKLDRLWLQMVKNKRRKGVMINNNTVLYSFTEFPLMVTPFWDSSCTEVRRDKLSRDVAQPRPSLSHWILPSGL